MKMRIAVASTMLLALAACDVSGPRRSGPPGEPMVPSAASPTGSVNSSATGGGVPTPMQPGGAGGVGSGNQPGRAGTR
ncbi:MAG: hypothetical protein JWP04_3220 [Belnapia sp.]|nr:hypothetical protein [Belnapia sp.]